MNKKKKISALVIDDEPLARERIRSLLKRDEDIFLMGECRNGKEALEAILTNNIDLIFLDIQMPKLNGFEVIQLLDKNQVPEIIFVTAYDNYAIQAFAVHAVDYLLKPFDDERFFLALNRAKTRISSALKDQYPERIRNLVMDIPGANYLKRVLIKTGSRIHLLPINEVKWIKAEGYYAHLFTENDSHLIRETMNNLEEQIDPGKFVRIHRSTIINIEYIKELQTLFKGDYVAVLQNGEKFPISKHRNGGSTILFIDPSNRFRIEIAPDDPAGRGRFFDLCYQVDLTWR